MEGPRGGRAQVNPATFRAPLEHPVSASARITEGTSPQRAPKQAGACWAVPQGPLPPGLLTPWTFSRQHSSEGLFTLHQTKTLAVVLL